LSYFFNIAFDITRRIARILHWGARKLRGCSFEEKLSTFFSHRPQNWSLGSPQNTSGAENGVTLLNKADPTSQQRQFSVKESTQWTIWGHGPLSLPSTTLYITA